jgi:hypothetical protein
MMMIMIIMIIITMMGIISQYIKDNHDNNNIFDNSNTTF